MVAHGRTILGLPLLTISHASDAKSHGDLGLVYQRLPAPCMRRVLSFGWFGSCYQCLPHRQSGSGPTARGLYQTLPPRTHRLTIGVDLYKGHRVAHIITHYNGGEPSTPSEVAERSARHRKDFFHQAGRLVKNRAWWQIW